MPIFPPSIQEQMQTAWKEPGGPKVQLSIDVLDTTRFGVFRE
jgi:hypothetical protein